MGLSHRPISVCGTDRIIGRYNRYVGQTDTIRRRDRRGWRWRDGRFRDDGRGLAVGSARRLHRPSGGGRLDPAAGELGRTPLQQEIEAHPAAVQLHLPQPPLLGGVVGSDLDQNPEAHQGV